jgi:hypothetical protein
MQNIEYKCDLCNKKSSMQNCENEMSSVPDNASGKTYNILDTNDFNDDDIINFSDQANQREGLKPIQPLQTTAMNRFQIMLDC